jgi:dipeptidyl aminopeptidase/acylaminoacyl peptidase
VLWLEHDFGTGRARVMAAASGEPPRPLTPAGVDVGTRVWEYGGGSFLATGDAVVYADNDDQRLYRVEPGGAPAALTPAPATPLGERYADGSATPDGRLAVYVNESHRPDGVEQRLVVISPRRPGRPRPLVSGRDFYAAPRISPDGRRLAWICWDKPNMSWDGSELWCAELGEDGALQAARRVAGGERESVLAPSWSPDGCLHWVGDRSGWWNLETLRPYGARVALVPDEADYAVPAWRLGGQGYGFLADGAIVAVRVRDGEHQLVRVLPERGSIEPFGPALTHVAAGHLACARRRVALVGATPFAGDALLAVDAGNGAVEMVAGEEDSLDPELVAAPEPFWFAGGDGEPTHGFLHRPPAAAGPPPLILNLHGGPTDAAALALDPELVLWTSRGFALFDLDYSGSSGFGRAYRERLYGAWGDADLADCLAAVAALVAAGAVDPGRVLVRGGSAGGYLALRCLTRSDVFRAGLCRAGIADIGRWRAETHDFESRYPDLLVADIGDGAAFAAASPLPDIGPGIAPVLLVHGAADPVVPSLQSDLVAAAYRGAGASCRHLVIPGEPHDFRTAAGRERQLLAELEFAAASIRPVPTG